VSWRASDDWPARDPEMGGDPEQGCAVRFAYDRSVLPFSPRVLDCSPAKLTSESFGLVSTETRYGVGRSDRRPMLEHVPLVERLHHVLEG
jgi:hypothetical protein